MNIANLGAGHRPIPYREGQPTALNADLNPAPAIDLDVNLDNPPYTWLPRDTDLVILDHVLEHLRDPLQVLAELANRLRPGAYIALTTPHHTHPTALGDPTHRHVFPPTFAELVELRTPLHIIHNQPQGGQPRFLAWHLNHHLGIRLPRRGPGEHLWVFQKTPR